MTTSESVQNPVFDYRTLRLVVGSVAFALPVVVMLISSKRGPQCFRWGIIHYWRSFLGLQRAHTHAKMGKQRGSACGNTRRNLSYLLRPL
jgi:hypothetical protein